MVIKTKPIPQQRGRVFRPAEKFGKLFTSAQHLGFWEISEKDKQKLKEYLDIIAPGTPRSKDAWDCVIMRLDIAGYTIWFYPKYLRNQKQFTEHGRVNIVVTKTAVRESKIHYIAAFNFCGDFVKNITLELAFIVDRLKNNRPINDRNYADIERKADGSYEWVTRKNGKVIKRQDFYINLPLKPAGLIEYVYKRKREKMRDARIRKKTGAIPIRKKIKKWKRADQTGNAGDAQ